MAMTGRSGREEKRLPEGGGGGGALVSEVLTGLFSKNGPGRVCGMLSELPSVSFTQLSPADLLWLLENQPASSRRPLHHSKMLVCQHVVG